MIYKYKPTSIPGKKEERKKRRRKGGREEGRMEKGPRRRENNVTKGKEDPPGDLPDPGIEPSSPVSPALQIDSTAESPGKTKSSLYGC